MVNLLIYLTTVLIWGTTWIAIKNQVGFAAPEVSIFYRFFLATTLLILFCKWKKYRLRYSLKEHYVFFLLGLCMFSIHLVCVYKASLYVVSGLVSVLFSLVCLFNIINASLFLKTKPSGKMVLGALLGFLGISIFFIDEVRTFSFKTDTLYAVGLALTGSLIFSLGNIISHKAARPKGDLIPSTALAMAYGTGIMFLTILSQKTIHFSLPLSFSYWGALIYLAIPGTIVGFLCYLTLISRIGPERAGYATVFFPVIALFISIFFENYRMAFNDYLGVGLVIAGNCLVLFKKRSLFQSGQNVKI